MPFKFKSHHLYGPGLPVYVTGGIMLTDKPFLEAFGGGAEYPSSYVAACTARGGPCQLSPLTPQSCKTGARLFGLFHL